MGNPALGALGFIIGQVLNLYAMVVALRFIMQLVRADYYNPVSQFVVSATDPLLLPLRRVVPSIRRYDTASLLLCFLVLLIKLILFKVASLGYVPAIGRSFPAGELPFGILAVIALIDLIHLFFNIFIYGTIIQALLSWIPGASGNPAAGLLDSITRPILAPIRRVIPPIGGLDLSALVAIIGLFALQMLVDDTLIMLLLG